jgi:zinc/manganese transport system permease protein
MPTSTELSILGPAFLAGLLVLATHLPLGRMVLDRGIVFIDLAIAQVAGLGVVVADSLGWEPNGLSVQFAAVTAALLAAGFLIWTERRLAHMQEAIIGVVFVVAASAEIILFSFNPHGAEHLKDLLVGQIIWVTPTQLIAAALVSAVVLAVAARFDLRKRRGLFYALFAVSITASVQLVGVFLVFASLIIPALATQGTKRPILAGYGVGLVGYGLGLLVSTELDLPTGAAIVCTLAVTGAVVGTVRGIKIKPGGVAADR